MEQKENGVDRQDHDDVEVHLSIENVHVTPQTTADYNKLSKFPPCRLVSVLKFYVLPCTGN